MKKILFVVSQIGTGGAERVISTLASDFAEKGNDVTVITFRDTENAYPISSKVNMVRVTGNPLQRALAIRKYIQKHRIEVYVSFELNYGCLCAFGTGVRYITSMRNDPKHDVVSTRERVFRFMNFLLADHIVFQTEEIMSFFPTSIRSHGSVIMNPLKEGLDEYHGVRRKEIVAVCRLEKQKNIPMMIQAFQKVALRHPDFVLKLYGDGGLRSEMEQIVQAQGLKGRFLFAGFQSEIDKKIKDAYMYICTSDYEGLSNSLLEAMAIGLPCVTTDSGGGGARAVILDGVNGHLVPVGDADAMSSCMNRLIEDQAYADELSLEASKIRKVLSREVICREWEKLFI